MAPTSAHLGVSTPELVQSEFLPVEPWCVSIVLEQELVQVIEHDGDGRVAMEPDPLAAEQ
eukprot:6294669-Prymnesium_polylepis.2